MTTDGLPMDTVSPPGLAAAPAGGLLLLTGPMFAGKSSALIAHARRWIEQLREDGAVLVLKPAFDLRDGVAVLSSRDGSRTEALPVSCWPAQARAARVVVLDEVQFMTGPHYAGDIVQDVLAAVSAGKHVVAGGLDTDYRRHPFEPVARLADHAERHVRLSARCHVCDAPAAWTAKRQETGRRLELGSGNLYEARCDLHWQLPQPHPATRVTLSAADAEA